MSTLKTNNIQHVDRSDPSIIINTDGSVNIAGTMTYEDVTNVDAVGIITGRSNIDAQKQVHVGTGVSVKAGGINVTAGITTVQALQATTGTFTSPVLLPDGSVSAAALAFADDTDTGIFSVSQNTINFTTAGVERLEMGTSLTVFNDGGADVNFRIEGDTDENLFHLDASADAIGVGAAPITTGPKLEITRSTTDPFVDASDCVLRLINSDTSGATNQTSLQFTTKTNGVGSDSAIVSQSTSAGNSRLEFWTDTSNGMSKKMTIDASGRVLINTTTEGHASADNLTIRDTGNGGITIRTGTNSNGAIFFSDATSGVAEYNGFVQYNHGSSPYLLLGAGSGERMRITDGGHVTISATSYSALTINTSNDGTNGPEVQLMHTSTSPAANDVIGQLRYSGKDSAGDTTLFSKIETKATSVTNGSETGHIDFSTRGAGSYNSIFRLSARSTGSAPSYTTDDMNGIILDTYNTGNPYPRYFSFIAKSAGNTDSNIGFWTESVGSSPSEKVRITDRGTLYSGGGTLPSDFGTYTSSYRGREGVFGPIYYWPRVYGTHSNGGGYDDVSEGSRLTLRMYGAPGGTNAMFNGSFSAQAYGGAGEAISYNRVRVIFRTTRANTTDGYNANTITFKMQRYYYSGGWADISNSSWNFNGTDSERGYRWTTSNWISSSDFANGFDVPSIAIKYDTDNGNLSNAAMRIAAVYFQYAYFN